MYKYSNPVFGNKKGGAKFLGIIIGLVKWQVIFTSIYF
jgi:sensor domain CHASE-containing protein